MIPGNRRIQATRIAGSAIVGSADEKTMAGMK